MQDCELGGGFCTFLNENSEKYANIPEGGHFRAFSKLRQEFVSKKISKAPLQNATLAFINYLEEISTAMAQMGLEMPEGKNVEPFLHKTKERKQTFETWYRKIDRVLISISNQSVEENSSHCWETEYVQFNSIQFIYLSDWVEAVKANKLLSFSKLYKMDSKLVYSFQFRDKNRKYYANGYRTIFHFFDIIFKLLEETKDFKYFACGVPESLKWISHVFKVYAHGDNVPIRDGRYLGNYVFLRHCFSQHSFTKCACFCHKKKKLHYYLIYQKLLALQSLKLNNLGSLLTTLLYDEHSDIYMQEYFISEDRKLLADLFDTQIEIGLSEFISHLAQPSKVLNSVYEFPSLTTWGENERKEVQDLFNFTPDATYPMSGRLKMNEKSIKSPFLLYDLCSQEGQPFHNLTGYCNMSKAMPSIWKMMPLMRLATHPAKRYSDIGSLKIDQFKRHPTVPLPNLTFIPFCLYGNLAPNLWLDLNWKPNLEQTMPNDDPMKPDLYQYPLCQLFDNRPTDIGVCSTFNALELG